MYKHNSYITGLDRHFPPAIKEWIDSVYSYDKNNLRAIPFNHDQTHVLLKDYFNIHGRKSIGISRRVRSKMIRLSNKRIFVSKPEIKHSNDKSIVTLYVFDKERQYFFRKLFSFLRGPIIYNSWITNSPQKIIKLSSLKALPLSVRRKYAMSKPGISLLKSKREVMFNFERKRAKFGIMNLPFFGLKYQNELNFLRYKLSILSNTLFTSNKLLSYSFILYILLLFNINDKVKNNLIDRIVNNEDKPENMELLINSLWKFIEDFIINTHNISHRHIKQLYKYFIVNRYKEIINELYKDEAKLLYNYTRMEMNKIKFTNLIPSLKILLSKLHNRTIELNIVNLKYIYLNSDLFGQAIASRLRRKASPLKVLKRSFNLVKMPLNLDYRFSANKLSNLNLNKNLSVQDLLLPSPDNRKSKSDFHVKDKLDLILNKSFPKNIMHNNGITSDSTLLRNNLTRNKINQVLNTVKFKWVAGIRLEAAGRLTRRNTASRSAFFLRYKGNLKNKQFYLKDGNLRLMNIVKLRNNLNINNQYSFTKSKRRIGSFGLKSWISGY